MCGKIDERDQRKKDRNDSFNYGPGTERKKRQHMTFGEDQLFNRAEYVLDTPRWGYDGMDDDIAADQRGRRSRSNKSNRKVDAKIRKGTKGTELGDAKKVTPAAATEDPRT